MAIFEQPTVCGRLKAHPQNVIDKHINYVNHKIYEIKMYLLNPAQYAIYQALKIKKSR